MRGILTKRPIAANPVYVKNSFKMVMRLELSSADISQLFGTDERGSIEEPPRM